MPISIRPLTPGFAGEVAGIDCRRPLDAQEVAAIEAGMDRYAVLAFRDQPLSDELRSQAVEAARPSPADVMCDRDGRWQ